MLGASRSPNAAYTSTSAPTDRRLAQQAAAEGTLLPDRYWQLEKIWVVLGFPAFFGLVAVFWLMVAKPS